MKDTKRCLLAGFAAFVVAFSFDSIFHGRLMQELYRETSMLWRTHEEMRSFFIYLLWGHMLMAMMLSFIFSKNFEGKGWQEGARFGFYMGLFQSGGIFIQYAVMPLTFKILLYWLIGMNLQSVLVGITIAMVYGCKKCTATA